MIRHAYGGCLTCHTDPSGGELLTPYGRVQGDLLLRMRYGGATAHATADASADFDSFDSFDSFDEETEAPAEAEAEKPAPPPEPVEEPAEAPTGFLWGLIDLPEWLLLGGSYRHLNVLRPGEEESFSTFPMQADLYGQVQFSRFLAGGSIGVAKVEPGSPHARRAQITTNQGNEWNLISRTHYVGLALGSQNEFIVRGGRLNLPFGVRIPEHTMWVREATRTDRDSDQQHGVALAYAGESFRAEVMAIAGNYQINPDRLRERGYSLYLEGMLANWAAVGVSSLFTTAEADIATLAEARTNREAHGVFARLAVVPPLVILAEANVLMRTDADAGYVGFVQADFEVVQGLHFMATGELLDAGLPTSPEGVEASPGLGQTRYGGWLSVDWFFLPQLEARVDAVFRTDDPFTLLGQLHVYL